MDETKHIKLLRDTEVAAILAVSRRQVWRLSSAERIPAPVTVGAKSKRWRSSDIESHLEGLK